MLEAIATRTEAARRLEAGSSEAVLRSIVEATVTLFQAHAASIALYDPASNRLVFRVAAGEQGSGVLGLSIPTDQGIAGYVFSTGQAIAISDVGQRCPVRACLRRTDRLRAHIDRGGAAGRRGGHDRRPPGPRQARLECLQPARRGAGGRLRAPGRHRDLREPRGARHGDTSGRGGAAHDRRRPAGGRRAGGGRGVGAGPEATGPGCGRSSMRVARLRRADPAQIALVADLVGVLAQHAERSVRPGRRGRASRTAGGRVAAPGPTTNSR